jgi:hypothetical protein
MIDEERLAHYRQLRANALEAIKDVDEGRNEHFDFTHDGTRFNATAEWRDIQQRTVDMMDRLIPAWEKRRAERG